MGHRINERNTGGWSIGSEPKTRRAKSEKFTDTEKLLLAQVLEKVLDCLECDPLGRGHLHPESRWTDGGNFLISMTGAQRDELYSAFEKLGS